MAIEDSDIDDAASKPKSVSSDNRSVVQHSPLELVQAQRLMGANEAADTAAVKPHFGVRFSKIVPPGCG